MKLLIVTQKVDRRDPILGFFHRWIEEFSKHFEKIIVICLEEGEHNLPDNVEVHSLGKDKGASHLHYLKNFYDYISGYQNEYDAVFVHMNQKYILLGGLLWRLWGKKVLWWKTHGHLSFGSRVAVRFVHTILTASEKSFPIATDKKRVVGHGIDTNRFATSHTKDDGILTILSVGRLSPVKHVEDLIYAAVELQEKGINFRIRIVGPATKREYAQELKQLVEKNKLKDQITFVGAVPPASMLREYQQSDILVNSSGTDSMDKVVLEAMTSGVIPITSNIAFRELLKQHGLYIPKKDIDALADAIIRVQRMGSEERNKLSEELRSVIEENHSLEHLAQKIYEHAKG